MGRLPVPDTKKANQNTSLEYSQTPTQEALNKVAIALGL
jgi:hypothetical protein